VEINKQYQVKISNRFTALDNLENEDVDISRAWESISETMKASGTESLGYYLKQHKLWFDEECSELLDQRRQAKLQWLQNPSQTNGDNLNNVRCETNRTFRDEKREYVTKLISLKQTVRTKSETYIEA
jgi:uncharacterized protein YaaR (DUF327 family)